MSTVAINTKYVPLPELADNNTLKVGFKGEFQITSTDRTLPIEVGNDLVIIKSQNKDLIFTNSAIIKKIGEKDLIRGKPLPMGRTISYENKDRYQHHFTYEIRKTLHRNNRLSELEYSLPVVENYNKPEAHFQSQYRTLPKNDYETIVNGWIYATRTVFGKLVNALPRPNKLEFMIQAMDHFSTIDFHNVSLLQGLEFLYQYIDRRILSRGRLLVATDKILRKQLGDLLPADEVHFIDPESNSIYNISNQAKIFDNLFELERKKNLRETLKDAVKVNINLETRFEKLFKRRSWPVDLEK